MIGTELLSYLGMAILLLALYVSRTKYYRSLFMNLFGSIFLSIWALAVQAYAVLILNIAYFLIALYNIQKLRKESE